jgi:hypothetical protein
VISATGKKKEPVPTSYFVIVAQRPQAVQRNFRPATDRRDRQLSCNALIELAIQPS